MADTPLVSIRCRVYNHAQYLRQCLDGFVMQQTSFPFEAIVHDDASTDGSTDILREYAEKYPHIIKPIIQTENQYKKHEGTISRLLNEASKGKYLAECEGDDYWDDPHKLQKQVDFLESHPDYTMCCCEYRLYSERLGEFRKRKMSKNDRELSAKEIITHGGLFIATCSVVYRHSMLDCYTDYMRCHVGDYPLQILCAVKGKVHRFAKPMCVYRVDNDASWRGRQQRVKVDRLISTRRSEVEMLKGFASDYPEHAKACRKRISFYIIHEMPDQTDPASADRQAYCQAFRQELDSLPIIWKLIKKGYTTTFRPARSIAYRASWELLTR